MKSKIFLLFVVLYLLIWGNSYGQSIGYFRYDTSLFYKVGGYNELKLQNSTKAVIGPLVNVGNGITHFMSWAQISDSIGGGGGSDGNYNLNLGSGFRWAVPYTTGIKTAFGSTYITGDSSSNTNGITFKLDTTHIHTDVYNEYYYKLTAGDLSPLFTSSVTRNNLTFSLTNAGGGTVFGRTSGVAGAPVYTSVPILGIPGTTAGTLSLAGGTSGTVTIQTAAAAGTYNFNLPTTAGTTGQVLTSAGGGSSAMTWTTLGGGSGTVTDFIFTDANGFDGTVTSSTSTPTLSLTTTVTNTRLMYSNSGAIAGISGATSNGTAVTFTTSNLIATRPQFITSIDDANGNEIIGISTAASAVNELTVGNAATGANPKLSVTGGDTNIGLDFLTKGTGTFNLLGNATQQSELRFFEDTDNGTNYAGFKTPSSLAGNTVYTFPTAFPGGTYLLNSTTAGVLGFTDPAGFEVPLTFNSGLTRTSNTVTWGGTLLATTTMNTGGFATTFTGANTNTPLTVTNTQSGYPAIAANSVAGTAINAISSGGGTGILGYSTGGGIGGNFVSDASSTNTVVTVLKVGRTTSGTAAAGIGTRIEMLTEMSDGNIPLAATLDAVLVNATAGAELSNFNIGGKSTGSDISFMNIQPTGIVRVNNLNDTLATRAYARLVGGGGGGGGASTALDNLASVAINTSLLLGTSDGGALGSTTKQWSDLFLAEGGVINWDNGDATITQVGDVVTVGGADLKVTTPGNVSTSVLTTDATQTASNKRWTARVGSTASSATPTINTDATDVYKLTAQAANITSFTTNLSGTPVDGDILEIQITDNGTARTIAWGASFVSSTVTLPTTTVISTTLTVIFQYYTASSYGNNKWVCVNSY